MNKTLEDGHYNLDRTSTILILKVKLILDKNLNMNESNKLPQAISYKKLSFLLSNAQKDIFASLKENEHNTKSKDSLLEELDNWELLTKSLLKKISSRSEKVLQGKSSNSIMALGAMEVHLNMALQALNAFKKDSL